MKRFLDSWTKQTCILGVSDSLRIQCILTLTYRTKSQYHDLDSKVAVTNQLTFNSLTKMVIFTPFYLIINEAPFAIQYQELHRSGDPWQTVRILYKTTLHICMLHCIREIRQSCYAVIVWRSCQEGRKVLGWSVLLPYLYLV